MKYRTGLRLVLAFCLVLIGLFAWVPVPVLARSAASALAKPDGSALVNLGGAPLADDVSPYDLIAMMNALRVGNGLAALIEDPIINAVAQSTAQLMADTNATWHIGDAPGRIQAAGYGGGGKVYATENFAMGGHQTIDNIMLIWSDFDHMRPATGPYCNVGAGVATASNGTTYYVLQAAYVSGKSCGSYTSSGSTNPVTGSTVDNNTGFSLIVPVKVAEPNADGNLIHKVQYGQSLWLIAVAYKTTVQELRIWNNLPESYQLQVGDELAIPWEGAKGYQTPTPVGMIITSTPDAEGNIAHVVEAYQTLEKIGTAYGVSLEKLLQLNNWSLAWPLQIGQELIVKGKEITPTPTLRPLSPLEKLTPAADGKYYHYVRSGQNAEWIAGLYAVNSADLLGWNGLTASSILYPGDRLLLQVTPPPTATFTPEPPTATPIPPTLTATATQTPTLVVVSSASSAAEDPATVKADSAATLPTSPSAAKIKSNPLTVGGVNFLWVLPVLVAVIGAIEWNHRRHKQ